MFNRSALQFHRHLVCSSWLLLKPLAGSVLALGLIMAQSASAIDLVFTNYTTANGLGGNTVKGVFVNGSTIYAATSSVFAGGLSISTNGGNSFITRTTANGLGSNQVSGVYVVAHDLFRNPL